ncbi:MAG TPA: DMT family transporter, partial [Methylomirabilota bacterium]|nr:DMT family transporter [Methylomirabilota bacterium]
MFALFAGATGIGFAPILVRWSEAGPSATAFYRVLFALPLLWLLGYRSGPAEGRLDRPQTRADLRDLALAGLFFVGDLAVWHWSLQFTTVANSTLLTNFTPLFVALGAWSLLGERPQPGVWAGMLMALGGAGLLVEGGEPGSRKQWLGDLLAVIAAISYAGYILMVKRLRQRFTTPAIMVWSGLVSCPGFFVVAVVSGDRLVPGTAVGWMVLVGLAVLCHVGGQALIARGLGGLPASFSSVGLLWQPVVAAVLAWLVFNEVM